MLLRVPSASSKNPQHVQQTLLLVSLVISWETLASSEGEKRRGLPALGGVNTWPICFLVWTFVLQSPAWSLAEWVFFYALQLDLCTFSFIILGGAREFHLRSCLFHFATSSFNPLFSQKDGRGKENPCDLHPHPRVEKVTLTLRSYPSLSLSLSVHLYPKKRTGGNY